MDNSEATVNAWYGWIPTNLGELQFEYITRDQNTQTFPIRNFTFNVSKTSKNIEIDASNISDTLKWQDILVKENEFEEIRAEIATILINYSEQIFNGNISVKYPSADKGYSADFTIKLNGEACFTNLTYLNCDQPTEEKKKFHQLTLYILLKSIVHGDNHHHQKIDVALKVTEKQFDVDAILHNLLIHIKSIERNIKRLSGCSAKIEAQQAYHELEGYISYCKTFYELFNTKIAQNAISLKLYKNLENIKTSAKAKIDKEEKRNLVPKNFLATFTILTALTISISILLKPQAGFTENLWVYTLYGIPLILLAWIERCAIVNFFRSKSYNYYEILKYLWNVEPKKLSIRGHIIQIAIHTFPWILFISSGFFLLIKLFPQQLDIILNKLLSVL